MPLKCPIARKAYRKARYEANKASISVQAKQYRDANKESIANTNKVYYETNKENISARAKIYRDNNKGLEAAKSKAYRAANAVEIKVRKKIYRDANKDIAKLWRDNNKDVIQQYRIDNKLSIQEKAVIYRKNNNARLTEYGSKYRLANLGAKNFLLKKYRASKINRTPVWTTETDLWMMKEIYELSALRTKLTGVSWHVDHIIPLQGAFVSGLHTPFNMQVIPAIENIKKGNKYEF
jgi:hypothetical protein